MDCDELRRALLLASSQNRPYEFLRIAVPYIEQVPEDTQVRLLALRHFAQLGLFGPGIELIDDRPEVFEEAPELVQTVAPLRQQPTGRVEWETLAPTFEQNLAVACERFEDCAQREERLRDSVRNLDLYRDLNGNPLLSRRTGRAPRRWLPGISNWAEEIGKATLLPDDMNIICLPYMIEGVAVGHVLRKIYDGTSKMFLSYTPMIHLLEPNIAQFAVWLHLDDHRDILRDERFHPWLGEDGADRFVEYYRARPAMMPPLESTHQRGWAMATQRFAPAAIKRLGDERNERADRAKEEILAKLAGHDNPAHYADRFAARSDRPLRILGITSRFTTFLQYSMRDIQRAAISQGHEFRILIEENDHTPILPSDYTRGQIAEFLPDLIVILDHNRKEYGDSYDMPIPFCNWIQDDLPNLFGPDCGKGLHPYDLVVGTIGNWKANNSGYPREQWHFLPVPVSLATFSNDPISPADRRKHECDISFASHLHTTRDELLRETLNSISRPEIRKLVETQFEQLGPQIASGKLPGSPIQTIGRIQELANELGFMIDHADADRLRRIFTDRLINSHFREQALEWASDMGLDLHIYGKGWERHPKLAKHAKGVAEHGEHLRCIYQASRINLQAVPIGAVHQRLLEGLCSGGFFAIRRTPSDSVGELSRSITQRCMAMNIQTDDELWNTTDEALARDVRALNDTMYSPSRLYNGFVADLHIAVERGYFLQADVLLPHYQDVAFATREEFERVVSRLLTDEPARREIAAAQREVVAGIFSYESLVERVLDFAQRRFADLAAAEPAPTAAH